jgi:uncharacterized membrane protein YfcA
MFSSLVVTPILALQAALAVLTALFAVGWSTAVMAIRRAPALEATPATDARLPGPTQIGIGAITNFFDTLGIGSFATTTAMFRALGIVPDRVIPGTLNTGHTLPTVAQAFIYTTMVEVDILTLFSFIAAAVLGAWLGAGIVASWPRQKVQIGMGAALLGAATLMLMTQLNLFPGGGEALGVRGTKLFIGVGVNFFLGALMSLGIGLYAPCMILVSLLGMNPTAAFPIMMGSCAFLMPVGSLRFIRERSYSLRAALGLAIGGIPGVLLAAYIITSMPIYAVRWLVIVVVVYTAVTMLMSGLRGRGEHGSTRINTDNTDKHG